MLNSVFLVNYFVVFHSLYALQDLKVNLETVKVLEKPNKRPLSIYAINKNIGYLEKDSSMLVSAILHKGKMTTDSERTLQAYFKHSQGEGQRKLGHFVYSWLKQVVIIFVCSYWLGLVRGRSGLYFPIFRQACISPRLCLYFVITWNFWLWSLAGLARANYGSCLRPGTAYMYLTSSSLLSVSL